MNRAIEIAGPIDVGETIMTLAARDAVGSFKVRISLIAWERLRMAPPYLDDEDRRDAALLELEHLCSTERARHNGGERIVDITDDGIDDIVARLEVSAGS
jgi:hypothetical protein